MTRAISSCTAGFLSSSIIHELFYTIGAGKWNFVLFPTMLISLMSSFEVFSALRVHVLSQRDWRMTVTTLGLALVPVVTNIVRIAVHPSEYELNEPNAQINIVRTNHFLVRLPGIRGSCSTRSDFSASFNIKCVPGFVRAA